jgi:hypothetical protein
MRSASEIAKEIYDAELAPADFDRRLRRSLESPEEMAEVESLIRWFSGRYPSARERLAYARRRYAELTRR